MVQTADALRDLAAASSSGQAPVNLAEQQQEAARQSSVFERDPAEQSASALAMLSGSECAPYDPGMTSTARRRHTRKPTADMLGLRLASLPVLAVMGLAMLALAGWGILVMMGNTTLPMATQTNASQLAIIGLIGLPIGLLFFACAAFLGLTVIKDKKKLARWQATYGH